MALTKKQKVEIVGGVDVKLAKQKSVVFTDFTGLNVAKIQTLRKQLREKGIEFQVIKKTLLGIALKKNNLDVDLSQFGGSIAVAIGYDDQIAPSKLVFDFSKIKENNALNILGGIFENGFVTKDVVAKLARIPSREVLLAQVASTLIGPIRGLAIVLDSIRKQKEA